jgi:hypothetical protein
MSTDIAAELLRRIHADVEHSDPAIAILRGRD